MGSHHTKRYNTPKYIHISKKKGKFFINTKPGPHPKRFSLPLVHVLRDVLKLVDNKREASKVIQRGEILIDGKIQKDPRYAVGLMDVIEIPSLEKAYRVLPKEKIGLWPLEISKKEKEFKLCRIENKSTLKNGFIQLNLHDGRNIVIPVKDPKKPKEDTYKTMGVLKINIPSQEIVDYFPFKENVPIVVVKGKNLGRSGTVVKIEKRFGPNASTINIDEGNDSIHETAYAYSFVVGKSKPIIKLFEN